MRRAQGYFGTSEPGLLDNPRLEGPASLQLRLSLLDDEPNSTFFISLILSESRGQSQEKECCAQSLALESAALELAVCGCLALSECNAKFAGRRKPGGGYTYFDFMQNRNFDIAGPNPTPEEQKHIDEQYTAYLDNQRRSTIAAAFAAKQQQLEQSSPKPSSLNQGSLKQASLKQESLKQTPPKNESEKAPTTSSIGKPKASAGDARRPKATDSRATDSRATDCARHSFSCDWPRLSESIKDLKKVLFGSSSSKDKRS